MDHYGVLDFGLQTSGNSLHAMSYKTIYTRTCIHVPKEDDYLFLLQTDDEMLLWIDDRLVYRYNEDEDKPVTRSAERHRIHLTAGEHRIRMRVNQTEDRWQAAMRIRTKEDDLSDVTGLPASVPEASPVVSVKTRPSP
jgi:hypothetical protein